MQDQDPKLTLADAEVIQPNPVIVGGGGKIPSMAKIAAMLAQTFMPMNHAKPQYKPKNLLSVDYDAKLSAADAKRLKRQQRNIKNAS